MKSRRFKTDETYSALCFFRAWRPHLGARQAYWATLFRFGWPGHSLYAQGQLTENGKKIAYSAT